MCQIVCVCVCVCVCVNFSVSQNLPQATFRCAHSFQSFMDEHSFSESYKSLSLTPSEPRAVQCV